jgi:hypothetical protein
MILATGRDDFAFKKLHYRRYGLTRTSTLRPDQSTPRGFRLSEPSSALFSMALGCFDIPEGL